MWFKIAAFRNKFRPRDLCFAHTAILLLPLSTMLVAGCENWGDSREVMRNNRSLRFFFCIQECSPSISAAARLRFLGRGCGRGRNVRPMSGRGSGENANVVGVAVPAAMMLPKRRFNVEFGDACSFPARIILRCPASCVACMVTGRCGHGSAYSHAGTISRMDDKKGLSRTNPAFSDGKWCCGYGATALEPCGSHVMAVDGRAPSWVNSIQC